MLFPVTCDKEYNTTLTPYVLHHIGDQLLGTLKIARYDTSPLPKFKQYIGLNFPSVHNYNLSDSSAKQHNTYKAT